MRLGIRVAGTVAAIVCLSVGAASAETLRGDQLLMMLTNESASGMQANVSRYRGMGYIQGLLDSYAVFSARDPSLNVYCMPKKGVSSAQARILIVRWLKANPERLHEQARLLVFHALSAAFPCPELPVQRKAEPPEQIVVPRQN